MKLFLMIISCLFIVLPFSKGYSQEAEEPQQTDQQQPADDTGEVLMLEEIRIEVAPELPTVVVTIQRQKPDIERITIQNPLNRMRRTEIGLIKPDLSKMEPTDLRDTNLMLDRRRSR